MLSAAAQQYVFFARHHGDAPPAGEHGIPSVESAVPAQGRSARVPCLSGTPTSSDLPCRRRHSSNSTTCVLFRESSSTYAGHAGSRGGPAGGVSAAAPSEPNVRRRILLAKAATGSRPVWHRAHIGPWT